MTSKISLWIEQISFKPDLSTGTTNIILLFCTTPTESWCTCIFTLWLLVWLSLSINELDGGSIIKMNETSTEWNTISWLQAIVQSYYYLLFEALFQGTLNTGKDALCVSPGRLRLFLIGQILTNERLPIKHEVVKDILEERKKER